VTLPVRYDGADLDAVAAASSLTASEVVRRHSSATYVAAFCGFAPGFAYLTGLDPALHLPRRSTPRTRVPAGAVAIAGDYTAVYPHPSPGGWHLLGHTDAPVWDVERPRPNLLVPGTRVRFEVIGR
jgi:KipI family sensor histidine kinase inhibitor